MSGLFSIIYYDSTKGHALREPLCQGLKTIYRAKGEEALHPLSRPQDPGIQEQHGTGPALVQPLISISLKNTWYKIDGPSSGKLL